MTTTLTTSVWHRVRAAGGDFYRARIRRDVPILMFHRIRLQDGTSPKNLADILDHVADRYRVITLAELAARLNRQERLPADSIVLTFDDCTKDQFALAAPALQERGLHATFAVIGCTLIERRLPILYWYFHLIESTTRRSVPFGFDPLIARQDWPLHADGRRQMMDWRSPLLQTIIRTEPTAAVELVTALGEALDVPKPDVADLFMTLDELKALEAVGHEAAAHTMRHVDVNQPDPTTWRRELRENFALMTDLFGRRPHSFIFPFGYDRSPEARDLVQAAGFGCAATTEWGTNTRTTDPYALRRVGVDSNTQVPLATIY